jgi:hypothetical protein
VQIRHATISLGSTTEEVVILEATKAEAVKLLETASFSAPVLIKFSEPSSGPGSIEQTSEHLPANRRPSLGEVLDILRHHPERYRPALEEFVRKHPDLGPASFFREFFRVDVSAHGESRLVFNSLYTRMRTVRARLGLKRQVGSSKRRHETRLGPGTGAPANELAGIPKPSEIRTFMEKLVLANRPVSTKDLQDHFYGPGFSPSNSPADHLRNKRLVDYAAVARKSLARRWNGEWKLVGPAAGPNVAWKFLRSERQEILESEPAIGPSR